MGVKRINEVEISPLNTQKQLIGWCHARGIHVTAMSTFSHFRSSEPRLEIIEKPKLVSIARAHNKSVVQIVLRWLIQQKVAVISKTWNLDHLKENISIFDFTLTDDEIGVIDSLDQGEFLNYKPHVALKNLPEKYKGWKGYE